MSNQFLAEIRIVPFQFAPQGWAFCDGQILPLSQNTALFSLLGTTYGGDGKSNFALPNLQGMAPMQQGQGPGLSLRDLGESSGVPNVTLIQSEIPVHTHTLQATVTTGTSASPSNTNELAFANAAGGKQGGGSVVNYYSTNTGSPNAILNPAGISVAGGSLPHNNMMPFLVLNYIIALQGVFPARS
jgi:microcystin-dependent protein